MRAITPTQFRQALGNYATGVAIISARGADRRPIGMTVNSFASVSLEPPLVLWSVDEASPLFDAFVLVEHYAVQILRQDQQRLAHRFSDDNIDKFAGLTIGEGIADLPLLTECSVLLQCEVVNRHKEGDHVILIARVVEVRAESSDPLVFFASRFRRLQI